jgi:RNA recognition motif-containing protein
MAATTSQLSIPNLNLPLQKWSTSSPNKIPLVSFKSISYPSVRVPVLSFQCAAVQETTVTESDEVALPPVSSPEPEEGNKRKLYVLNLPWNLSGPDIKKIFSECGTVKDVEVTFILYMCL